MKYLLKNFVKKESVDKPSSVVDGYLSRRRIAPCAQATFRNTSGKCIVTVSVAPNRVYSIMTFPYDRWALTSPFHPYRIMVMISRNTCVSTQNLWFCNKFLLKFVRIHCNECCAKLNLKIQFCQSHLKSGLSKRFLAFRQTTIIIMNYELRITN